MGVVNNFDKEILSGKKWIIINQCVYDIEHFSKIHPGGSKIISSFIGKDATDAWVSMHPDKNLIEKYMVNLKVGSIPLNDNKNDGLMNEYHKIRDDAIKEKLFETNWKFYFLTFIQIPVFEFIAWMIFYIYGVNIISFISASIFITMAQAQAGWSQHDYGHLSVFNTNKLNKIIHQIIIGHFKGASSSWWNFRHNLHHSKPNSLKYDPDIGFSFLYLVGTKLPLIWAHKKQGVMPYNRQHQYFLLTMPPLLLPLYFHYENIYFVIKRGKWQDFLFQTTFFLKFFGFYGFYFDTWLEIFWFYMFSRFLESYWFTLITQMSHIPMESDINFDLNWFKHQLETTCNVECSTFNDWFTGHLNFQIEHHLFPNMPRHNYRLIKPRIVELCKKYNIRYQEKSLSHALMDILNSLKHSGELWLEAYTKPG